MNKNWLLTVVAASLALVGCQGGPESDLDDGPVGAAAEALVSVGPPDFSVPNIGYWCSAIWPTAGWALNFGVPGDENANPCSGDTGATTIRTGMYSTGTNVAEVWCAPNYYWIYVGQGTSPLSSAFNAAANTQTNGNCLFRVTIGSSVRQPLTGPTPFLLPAETPLPLPAANASYHFDHARFVSRVQATLPTNKPGGYQLAVRDPQGNLVETVASGWVVNNVTGIPNTVMTKTRRLDMASASKTLTATAMMAALEDLANLEPGQTSLGITLDTSIKPYLPSNWNVPSTVDNITFRMVLEHKSGLCPAQNMFPGDSYANVKQMIETGATNSLKGQFVYCGGNYALLRVLIPYVVDGPQAYQPFESDAALNAKTVALSYRNYVRGRLLAPLGLFAVDDFYTGPLPETIYYNTAYQPVADNVNITTGGGYDQTADNMVLTAGSGNWTMSAEEMSYFISNLWQGKIISPASVSTMLAAQADNVGKGNFGTQITLPDGTMRSDLDENGGGWAGGPSAQWTTFFNGYTAVYLTNTPAAVSVWAMEDAAKPTFVPSAWTCSSNYYDAVDGCDCNCGAWDPDCDLAGQTLYGCTAGQHCAHSGSTGVCSN